MEEGIDLNEAELRRALMFVIGREGSVDQPWLEALIARGYAACRDGRFVATDRGRRFLMAVPHRPEAVRQHVIREKQLRGVVPLGQERVVSGGGRIVAVSAEIWTDEVVVRFTALGVEPLRHGPGYLPWELRDGVTTYRVLTEGGDGSGVTSFRHVRFGGTVPERPTQLRLVPAHVEPVEPFLIEWPGAA